MLLRLLAVVFRQVELTNDEYVGPMYTIGLMSHNMNLTRTFSK